MLYTRHFLAGNQVTGNKGVCAVLPGRRPTHIAARLVELTSASSVFGPTKCRIALNVGLLPTPGPQAARCQHPTREQRGWRLNVDHTHLTRFARWRS
jgi:hypothetical protein